MRKLTLASFFALGCLFGTACYSAENTKRPPNIILFLVDDMGWMDSGAYGSRYYETPNIDGLAKRGMRFTDAYSANPLCSPTRASILTGKYPARHGITNPSGHLPPQPPGHQYLKQAAAPDRPFVEPESRHFLDPSEVTIAERLRDFGYRTGHFGKWHLGLTEPYWPEKQGFDVVFHGKPDPGPPSYFSPYGFKYQSFPDGPTGEYITDRLTTEALKFIDANRDRPFLLHMWQYGVHGPWGHKEEYTREFAQKKDPRGVQGNPIMASMLKSVDESLGRVVAKLDELGLRDNTIIIFTSDNGGNIVSNTPKDSKNLPKKLPPKRAALMADWRKWAGDRGPTDNTPLREGKGWLFEGGVRIPLVVVWPGTVEAHATSSVPVSSIDLFPTMLDMAGAEQPKDQIVDGRSIAPLLRQTGGLDREAVFNFFPHSAGNKLAGATVRAGDWKLIRWWGTNSQFPNQHELYNLRDDLGETKNLAADNPAKVKGLAAMIDGFLKETGALVPKPNPSYNPGAGKRAKTSDPLLGWVPKQCTAERTPSGLRITADGRNPFLANVQIKQGGPLVLRLRVRSTAGGAGKVQWRTASQDTFPQTGQIVPFKLPASGDWQEVKITLPIEGELVHFRLYPPVGDKPVEIAWAELGAAAPERTIRQWNFAEKP